MGKESFELPAETQAQLDAAVKTALTQSVQTQLPEVLKTALGINADGTITPANTDGEGNTIAGTGESVRLAKGMLFGAGGEGGAVKAGPAVHLKLYAANPYKGVVADGETLDGLGIARVMRLLAASKDDVTAAERLAKSWLGKTKHPYDEMIVKAMGEMSLEDGGILITPEYAGEIVPLLQARAVVRQARPQIITTQSGAGNFPTETQAPIAEYVGENTAQNAGQQPKFGAIKPQVKKLRAIIPISNELLSDWSYASDAWLRTRMARAHALREDLAFLRGDGFEDTPKGLKNWAGNTMSANATVNLANITADLNKLLLMLEEDNIDAVADNVVWFFAPRTLRYLAALRDSNGNLAFKDELATGKLLSRPYYVSNQIPTNLGGSSSEVYAAAMLYTNIFEKPGIIFESVKGGAYKDSTGAMISGISSDQTVLITSMRHDFFVTQANGVGYMDAVNWAFS